MNIKINHEERQRKITLVALDLFAERGYSSVSFREIAERCGVARTGIYRYYDDKRALLTAAIRDHYLDVKIRIREIGREEVGSARARILELMNLALERLFERRDVNHLGYSVLLAEVSEGQDVARRIRRLTILFRRQIARALRHGRRTGELRPFSVRQIESLLFAIIESATTRLAAKENATMESSALEVQELLDLLAAPIQETSAVSPPRFRGPSTRSSGGAV